jgi:pyruvate dehydrogenase E1 component
MDLSLDNDELETQEWRQALNSVIDAEGSERAHFLIEMMIDQARRSGSNLPYNATTGLCKYNSHASSTETPR